MAAATAKSSHAGPIARHGIGEKRISELWQHVVNVLCASGTLKTCRNKLCVPSQQNLAIRGLMCDTAPNVVSAQFDGTLKSQSVSFRKNSSEPFGTLGESPMKSSHI